MKKYLVGTASVLALPFVALAQGTPPGTAGTYNAQNIQGLFGSLHGIMTSVLSLLIALAGLLFVYALVTYITKAGDEKARESARNQMIWGVIIIAVMLSVWGLVNMLAGSFNFTTSVTPPTLPSISATPQ